MSKGFGGWGYLAEQDENKVIYQYGAYNLNEPQYRNEIRLADGIFIIDKVSLVEPDVRKKIKRFPNGKKKQIVKKIVVDVPYSQLYDNEKIQIKNCSNCWKTILDDKDFIAWHLIRKVFQMYQEEGYLPERVNYDV